MMKRIIIRVACAVCCLIQTAAAQDIPDVDAPGGSELPPATDIRIDVGKVWYRGDSIPHVIMPVLYKYPPLRFKNDKERDRYNRLVANVKKLLPYARLAKITVIETYEVLETMPTKEARAAHVRRVEADLRKTYTPVLKRLTRSQGRLLVKLIDRECGQTGYKITQAFIGAFKANVYQGVAALFGQSLNKRYDPEGDDRYTERVVRLVESGQI